MPRDPAISSFVAVLVDLFGNLEFAVCEVAGVFSGGRGFV